MSLQLGPVDSKIEPTDSRQAASAVLIAVAGPVASGKSTVARALASRVGAVCIEADRVHEDLQAGAADEAERWRAFAPDFEARIYAELRRRGSAALAVGRPVILDACFPMNIQRAIGWARCAESTAGSRSLRRRHLHPNSCRLASRFKPLRWRLLHDFPHTTSRLRLLPRAGFPPPVVVVPLGAVYGSFLSAAMHATAEARESSGAMLRVPAGAPLVEPKARTAEARLSGVVTDLRPRRPTLAPLLPVYANERRHAVGVSSSTALSVSCHGSAAPPVP